MSRLTKEHIFHMLEGRSTERRGRIFAAAMSTLIALNVGAVMLETVDHINGEFGHVLLAFEVLSVTVFTLEYALRVWSCTAAQEFAGPILGRIRFACTPLALIDLLAILPFYLPFIFSFDLIFLRALRLFRFVRVFKLGRYSESVQTLGNVLRAKREDLTVMMGGVLLLVATAACLMYFVEHDAQPNKFSSVPETMWWAAVTLTTVGYGDVYPVTPLGKFLGALIAFLGIGLFALPTSVLGAGFVEETRKRHVRPALCPHCGREV